MCNALFGSYNAFCTNAEAYRYARNKLDHPGCRTLEDSHLVPVVSFVKDICMFLDECYFLQKTREQLIAEATALQQRRPVNPIPIHNFPEMPYGESRIVCRDTEIQRVKDFVYGKPDDLRKQHSLCIYGYGGVGKTALILETMKQIVRDIQDQTTINEYEPQYMLFFSAKKRKLTLASETGRFMEQQMRYHFETADELIQLILSALKIETFRKFRAEGLIVVDNLETLSHEERQKVKKFIETQTPSEMQFVLTSRNSEEYETNYKLGGFDSEAGKEFISVYSEENASLLWLFGQYLSDINEVINAIRYLEESKTSFEDQNNNDQEYYQCTTKLGWLYLRYYLEAPESRITYLRRSREISRMLSDDWEFLGKARSYAGQLRTQLKLYG